LRGEVVGTATRGAMQVTHAVPRCARRSATGKFLVAGPPGRRGPSRRSSHGGGTSATGPVQSPLPR
jgi:hypothetical protein